MQLLQKADVDNVSLWMFLLLRLTAVSYDIRAEVRNGKATKHFQALTNMLSQDRYRLCSVFSILMAIN